MTPTEALEKAMRDVLRQIEEIKARGGGEWTITPLYVVDQPTIPNVFIPPEPPE